MKQTNNALTFLMAQYRAIFKNAYFKGLTTAMVVTAGLATANGVQAITYGNSSLQTAIDNSSGRTLVIDGTSDKLQFNGGSINNSTLSGTISITGGSIGTPCANFIQAAGTDEIKIYTNKLNLVISANKNEGLALLSQGTSNAGKLSINVGNIEVNKGLLALAVGKTGNDSGDVVVTANHITVGDGSSQGVISLGYVNGNTSYASPTNATITLGNFSGDTVGNTTTTTSTITLNEGGTIAFYGTSGNESKVTLKGLLDGQGGTLDFTSGSGQIEAVTTASGSDVDITVGAGKNAILDLTTADSKSLDSTFVTNGNIALGDENGSGTFTIKRGTLELGEESSIEAHSGSAIVFSTTNDAILAGKLSGNIGTLDFKTNGQLSTYGTDVTANIVVQSGSSATANTATVELIDNVKTADVNEGLLQFTDGTIKLAAGTANTNGAGKILVTQGTLAIEGETVLAATGTDTTNDAANLTVSGSAATASDPAKIATLRTSSDKIVSFLNAGDSTVSGDIAGALVISGAESVLELNDTDQVDLYALTLGTKKIFIDSGTATAKHLSINGGTIKATNLAVSASGSGLNLGGANLESDKLTLGGYEGFKSVNGLGFKKATTRDVVFNQDNTAEGAKFTLKDALTLRAVDSANNASHTITNPFDTEDTAFEYAGTGTIDGDVIVDASDPFTIDAGIYTNYNSVTLTNGSELKIGGTDGIDASLIQDGALALNGGKIKVQGSGDIVFNKEQKISRQAQATLNLRGTLSNLTLSGNNNAIEVSQGTILVTDDQMADILDVRNAQVKNSASVTIGDDGVLDIDGNFQGYNLTPLDINRIGTGKTAAGNITFSGDSTLIANSVWLGATGKTNSTALNIGDGTIVADKVTLDQEKSTTSKEGVTEYGSFTVQQGTIVAGSLLTSSHNNTNSVAGNAIVLGNGGAALQLGYVKENVDKWGIWDGTYTHSDDVGQVTQNLVLDGDKAKTDAGRPSLEVAYGAWDVQNIDITNGTLTVGSKEAYTNASGDTYLENGEPLTASIKGDGAALNLKSKATANIYDNGAAQFTQLNLAKDANGINIKGSLTVDGKYTAAIVDGNGEITTPASYGVNIQGGNIIVDGQNAQLKFGSDAVEALKAENLTITGNKVNAQGFINNINVQNYGMLYLSFADDVSFDAQGIKNLRKAILGNPEAGNGGALNRGFINIGQAKIDGLVINGSQIDWKQLQDFKDIRNELGDIMTDEMRSAALINVNSTDIINANVGAVRMNNQISDAHFGSSTLSNAAANENGYFVTNQAGAGDAMQIQVDTLLGLYNGGKIGTISLAKDATLFVSEGEMTNIVAVKGESGSSFLVDGNSTVAGDVTVDSLKVDQSLDVKGNTTVNSLTSATDNEGKLLVPNSSAISTKNLTVAGTANYAGNITTTKDASFAGDANLLGAVDVAGDLNISGSLSSLAGLGLDPDDPDNYVKAGGIKANSLNVSGSSFYVGDMDISGKADFTDIDLVGNNTFGDVTADRMGFYYLPNDDEGTTNYKSEVKNLTIRSGGQGVEVEGATLSAGVIKFAGDNGATTAKLYVGENLYTNDQGNEVMGNTGYLMADQIDLNGAALVVDPDFSKAASIATVERFGATATGNTLKGDVLALQNGIVAIGVERSVTTGEGEKAQTLSGIDQVKTIFKDYFADNGALNYNTTTGEGVGSILYVAKSLTVEDGSHLVASATMTRGTYESSDGSRTLSNLGDAVVGNDVYLGKGGALAINVEAGKDQAAIHFDKNNATIYSDGGKIVLVGNYNPSAPITLMKDNDADDAEGNKQDGVTVASGSQTIKIESLNGLYTFESEEETAYDAGQQIGTVNLTYKGSNNSGSGSDSPRGPWGDYSTPVYETMTAYRAGRDAGTISDAEANPLLEYVRTATRSARDVEVVSRLGAFGGAAQAALTAGATTYDAISGRMGVGANGANITVADNTQGAALWLTPVYKSRDADGFGAQGTEYGADVDLYGLALGADYTLANGVRVGAAFNIGSGDADGNGAGEGVSNDFDYYGFALYGSYSYGPWSVVADLSYTNVDNDIEANTTTLADNNVKLGTSFDSSNLSLGVTAQYQAILDGDVSVTPHAGLRYTKIDIDDYSVNVDDETIAEYQADDMSIFSIPVGVTVAKEFVNGSWTVKPSFDLTLTCNFGDDEMEGTTYWNEQHTIATPVASEVLDNFTYGATVGVAAKSGNFSLGFGLNYTGSSNTDEFGVNANARFVF